MSPAIEVDLAAHGKPGYRFVSTGDPVREDRMPEIAGATTEKQIVDVASNWWQMACEARQPELERLYVMEKLYAGFHYNPEAMRRLSTTNFAFSIVETVHPLLTQHQPQLEVMGREPMDSMKADKIERFANWLQQANGSQRTFRRNTRVKLKYGYSLYMLTCDAASGMPYPVDWSPYDWIPDPTARDATWAEFFFFAAPFPTRRLRAMFGRNDIEPDNYASPAYEVATRAYLDYYTGQNGTNRYRASAATNPDSTAPYLGSQPTGSVKLVPSGSVQHSGFDTTFVVSLVVRDYGTVRMLYPGKLIGPPAPGDTMPTETPCYHCVRETACPSGWRLIHMTADGKILADGPLDPAYGGLHFVVDWDYEHELRLSAFGEIDQIAPLIRDYNERKNLLNRSLRLSAAPVLVVTRGSGLNFDKAIEPGDVLEISRGSEMKWMEYRGPGAEHFEMLNRTKSDIDAVSGVHDPLTGQRPPGVEAGVAFRELIGQAAQRIQGKVPGSMEARWAVLTKLCQLASKKLKRGIWVRATDGTMKPIEPSDLEGQYDIMPAEGTATAADRRELEEKAFAFFQAGLIPPFEVLKRADYPDWKRLAMTMAMTQAGQPNTSAPKSSNGSAPKEKEPAAAGAR